MSCRADAAPGEAVLVVDTLGRAEAATTADYLASQGHRVELLTGLETIAPFMPSPARHHLLEKLMKAGVALTTHTALWEIGEAAVEAYNVVTWEPRTIERFDSVVFGSGGKGRYRALQGAFGAQGRSEAHRRLLPAPGHRNGGRGRAPGGGGAL